jgi:hypothetical protein
LVLAFVGCLLLSLSLRRHYRQVFTDTGAYERRRWPLRGAGYLCLTLALWPCIAVSGLWIGVALWLAALALAAFLQILLLTYGPWSRV